MVTDELLPEVAARGLARFVDVFCEEGAYEIEETRRIFDKAVSLGLGIKVHAEQLSHTGAARLAVAALGLGCLGPGLAQSVNDVHEPAHAEEPPDPLHVADGQGSERPASDHEHCTRVTGASVHAIGTHDYIPPNCI